MKSKFKFGKDWEAVGWVVVGLLALTVAYTKVTRNVSEAETVPGLTKENLTDADAEAADADVNGTIKFVVDSINRICPVPVDDITTMLSAAYSSNKVIQINSLLKVDSKIYNDHLFKSKQQESMIQYAMKDSAFRVLANSADTVVFDFVGKYNKEIFQFRISSPKGNHETPKNK